MPKLVKQVSIGGNGDRVEKWGIEVVAVNKFVARQRARAYARRKAPNARNVFTPEVESSNSVQSTFNDLFPETLHQEEYTIEVTVVRKK